MVLCKAGQYAENNYFGKKSGLLDQIGVGYGNIVSIDFKEIATPIGKRKRRCDNRIFLDFNLSIQLESDFNVYIEETLNSAPKCQFLYPKGYP